MVEQGGGAIVNLSSSSGLRYSGSPHVAYAGYWQYYPGHDAVDWIATGALNYGTVAYWSRWWSFDEIFGRRYHELAGAGKPLMIAELGSLATGGDRGEWNRAALTYLPAYMPRVRALLFYHAGADATVAAVPAVADVHAQGGDAQRPPRQERGERPERQERPPRERPPALLDWRWG